ncbi:flagellar basal body P-ring formation chaperone FlgA [Rhodoferax mekongensis]|uniref:flagellar basal body P-ring formation chaperone FlgA n=1 Tax=Rhodoferax mekongensis TaxID=3068341 RepID=UPI0028BDEB24|nr:flagellar basal body P-ring formation chaperone FlgA [Rhodoferax sp. TBRC 17199]MDT7514263.1 flagellar basal body P-ring formation chaperone FlgA [Rhodoferax sp. TBRC 17199]
MPSFFCTSVQRPLTRAMLISGLFLSTTANAQEQTGTVLQAMAQSWAKDAVLKAQRAEGSNLRMEVTVGALDSRVKLAACGNIEAYVPPGSRLWGRSRIGMRCVDGISRWNVTLPVTVRAMGEAWVVRNQVNSGANISESDVTRGEVDWAEEQSPVLADKTAWLGQTASRTLTTGQAMRQGMVRPAQVFQAGASVKIVAQGPGFQISSEAQALSAGVIGQQARVRMDNGRVASGTVLDMRTVKIDL